MYPHERSLVKRLEGKPFALLGVNSDEDRQAVKAAMAEEKITWPSWWDGGSTEGPIATEWQLPTWPTVYVIDAEGRIRHIYAGAGEIDAETLDAVVDALLEEMARKSR
jgi:Redoxin